MSIVAVVSAHGSPGATTTAVMLAAAWPPGRGCVLVEADPFGGVLVARFSLTDRPGVASLAAASRHGHSPSAPIDEHFQELPGGVRVLIGPSSPVEAASAITGAADVLSRWAGREDVDLIVDGGRIIPSNTHPIVAGADVGLMVVRPDLDQLRPAVAATHNLAPLDVGLVLVGDRPYSAGEIAKTFDAPVVGVVADDPVAAGVLRGARSTVRQLRRSRLARSIHPVVNALTTILTGDGAGVTGVKGAPV